MTSPSTYTSTLRVCTGNPGKHLPERDDVIGNSVMSPRNSLLVTTPVVSSPLSPGQSHVVLRLSTTDSGDETHGLTNGRKSELPPGEWNNNYQLRQRHNKVKVTAMTSRAVSVPASLHNDLESSMSLCEGEGQGYQRQFSTGVVKVTLLQPTSE